MLVQWYLLSQDKRIFCFHVSYKTNTITHLCILSHTSCGFVKYASTQMKAASVRGQDKIIKVDTVAHKSQNIKVRTQKRKAVLASWCMPKLICRIFRAWMVCEHATVTLLACLLTYNIDCLLLLHASSERKIWEIPVTRLGSCTWRFRILLAKTISTVF